MYVWVEVLTAMKTMIMVFSDVTPCTFVSMYQTTWRRISEDHNLKPTSSFQRSQHVGVIYQLLSVITEATGRRLRFETVDQRFGGVLCFHHEEFLFRNRISLRISTAPQRKLWKCADTMAILISYAIAGHKETPSRTLSWSTMSPRR